MTGVWAPITLASARSPRQGTHKNNLDGYRYIVQNFAHDKIICSDSAKAPTPYAH